MERHNKYDLIEKIIFQLGLRITSVEAAQKENTMNVFLNTRACISFLISDYQLLATGTVEQIKNYKLIADGVGIC